METSNFHYLFKFLVIGESSVGKSCIVLNFTDQKPRHHHQVTIACEFAAKTVDILGKRVKVQIWDTAGQENFRSITRSYYRTAVAAVVVYDITDRKSFEKVTEWLNELKDNSHSNITLGLVGNKLDLEKSRQVSYMEGLTFAKANKMRFTETCAFEINTVEPFFKALAEDVQKKIDNKVLDPSNEQIGIKTGELMKNRTSISTSGKKGRPSVGKKLDKNNANNKKRGCC